MRLMNLLDEEKEEDKLRERAKLRRLNEAAMKGSVTSLLELLQQDPDILIKSTSSLSDTPLHVAALLGHSAFAKQLLTQNPELATELNSLASSPLHMAAVKGHAETVKELLSVNPDMCLTKDRDGRTPLHLGAIKGRVEVLNELVRVRPEATWVLTGGGESGLHLSVKSNHLQALKVLVESVGKDDQFVNWRDSEGNSVLHIAVAKKQLEMIKYLLTNTKVEVNARNANGCNALDILLDSQRDLRDMEIKECLQKAGASRRATIKAQSSAKNQEIVEVLPPIQANPPILKETDSKHTDWLGRKRSALIVVASLPATVTFQASLSPPGGVWSDDYSVYSDGNPMENPHKAGLSVMAYTDPGKYEAFMISNTIAFLASLSIILLLISGLPMKRRRLMWIQMVVMIKITPIQVRTMLFHVTRISLIVWLVVMGLVFVGNVIRITLWLLRKYGYIKKKERVFTYVEDEVDEIGIN